MPARLANVTFDCTDALVVARFWSGATGRSLDPGASPGYASIGVRDAGRAEPAWFFERVAEPKVAKNRVHLDLVDQDPDAVERLVGLGATVVGEHQLGDGGHGWTVLQDPEGNEFCVAPRTYSG